MHTTVSRIMSFCLAAVLAFSSIVTGTLSWQSINQQARNEIKDVLDRTVDVELIKLEKDADGAATQTPVPGAAFYLFKKDGTQVGTMYTTDEQGKIAVSLKKGEYYFEESAPASGFGFDTDAQGDQVTRYPFTVAGTEEETVTVTAYNVRLKGALTVQKVAQNEDGKPLTEAQKQREFTFRVTFSDGGTYSYRVDGGAAQTLQSGGTLKLRHGQAAVFADVPVGVSYTVAEVSTAGQSGSGSQIVNTDTLMSAVFVPLRTDGDDVQVYASGSTAVQPNESYTVTSTGSQGTITEEGCTARFVNTFDGGVSASLRIEMKVEGEGADLNKEFELEADIGGVKYTFKLKHGESYTFSDIPIGTKYTITQKDYTSEGYTSTVGVTTGTVTEEGVLILLAKNVYKEPEPEVKTGTLRVTKQVFGANVDPEKLFTFQVTFSDPDAKYSYSIDGGEAITATGATITFRLKGGQTATFVAPEGVTYKAEETDPAGYVQMLGSVGGAIMGDAAYATFMNMAPDEHYTATLHVTKRLAGEYPAADADKLFHFTLLINGVPQGKGVDLKNGETTQFTIPAGASYELREDDYFADGYSLTGLTNGSGTAQANTTIDAVATNTYVGEVQAELSGEKTWDLNGQALELPESITVYLKDGTRTVAEQVVHADDDGRWIYTFTAPKYDADGNEIAYSVEEAPVTGFVASYSGMNITNKGVSPVEIDPPVAFKVIQSENAPNESFNFYVQAKDGAPLPDAANGMNPYKVTVETVGERTQIEFGNITFHQPGTYVYELMEENSGKSGWVFDSTIYVRTVVVEAVKDGNGQPTGALAITSQTLTKKGDASPVDGDLTFTNTYTPTPGTEMITVSGTKTWIHGSNTDLPTSIIVSVYGDGTLKAQRLVTANDGWQYSFEVPRYAEDGHEIQYTVDEADVPSYTKAIQGYNITNTYQPDPEPTTPGTTPKTGDGMRIWPWAAAMLLSGGGLAAVSVARRKRSSKGHRISR